MRTNNVYRGLRWRCNYRKRSKLWGYDTGCNNLYEESYSEGHLDATEGTQGVGISENRDETEKAVCDEFHDCRRSCRWICDACFRCVYGMPMGEPMGEFVRVSRIWNCDIRKISSAAGVTGLQKWGECRKRFLCSRWFLITPSLLASSRVTSWFTRRSDIVVVLFTHEVFSSLLVFLSVYIWTRMRFVEDMSFCQQCIFNALSYFLFALSRRQRICAHILCSLSRLSWT